MNNYVLIIDELVPLLEAFSRFLRENGYNVISALDAEEALKKIKKIKPKLAVMMLSQSKISGLEFAKLAKAVLPNVMVALFAESFEHVDESSSAMKSIDAIVSGSSMQLDLGLKMLPLLGLNVDLFKETLKNQQVVTPHRREFPRYSSKGSVFLTYNGKNYICAVRNLSFGGLGFVSPVQFPVGINIYLRVHPPERKPFEIFCRIVRVQVTKDDRIGVGVKFIDLSSELRAHVDEWIKNVKTFNNLASQKRV